MLVMGYINHNSDILIDYNGDSSVGAIIQLFFTGDIPQDNSNPDDIRTPLYLKISKSSASLDDASSEMTIKLSDMSPSLKVGDTIIISTIKGNKSIYLYRDNTEYNIINYLDKESDWIQLTNNENYISCYFSDDEDDSVFIPDISLSVSYNISYEGV
jgi:hypothetical protein